jgi:hypothetical protein
MITYAPICDDRTCGIIGIDGLCWYDALFALMHKLNFQVLGVNTVFGMHS